MSNCGSIRLRLTEGPLAFEPTTQMAPSTAARPVGVSTTGIAFVTLLVSGSIRETFWSSRFATQSEPEPETIAPGRDPTEIVARHPVRIRVDHGNLIPLHGHTRVRAALAEREDRDRERRREHADQGRAGVHAPSLAAQLDVERSQLRELVLQPVDVELIEALRLIDVLQAPFAQISNRDTRREVFLGQLPRRGREQHLAAVAGRADTRGAMDADPDVALLAHPRLTRVQAHAHSDCTSVRPALGRQVALSVDGGRDGVGSRAEGDEERIALRVHHPPVVGGEGTTQQPLVLGEHLRVAVAAQLMEQLGRALDVREQEGDGPARNPRRPLVGGRARERGIVLEDRALEPVELLARLDAELVDQQPPPVAVDLQRLRLPPRAVEGEHELSAQALAQRVFTDERLELGDDVLVSCQREIGFDALLETHEPALLQAGDRRLRERLVGDVRKRRPSPECEGVRQRGRGPIRLAGSQLVTPLGEERLEARRVEIVTVEPEHVPAAMPLESSVIEGGAELRDVDAHRLRGSFRRVLGPELVHQPVDRHRLVRMEQEDRQQCALLGAAKRHVPGVR